MAEIREIIDNRDKEATAPYLVYRFNQTYRKYFGKTASYEDVKKQYNDLVMSMEDALRERIDQSDDPLLTAFSYSRAGNYIDFGAIRNVDENTFLSLLERDDLSAHDLQTFESFTAECAAAKSLLLLADNCGEIVLDNLFLEKLRQQYPQMKLSVLVRGGEVLNDATVEDALYAGIDRVAEIISSGVAVSGTVYDMISDEAKNALDSADVILSKGQGNYEALSGQGRHIFYSFLCKCERFTDSFQVPSLTGMFVEETEVSFRMKYKIRIAVPTDEQKIRELFVEMLKSIYRTDDVEDYEDGYLDKFWTGQEDRIYVAEDREVVAFLSVEVHHEPQKYIYLDDFSVTAAYRNKGIGSELICAAEYYAIEKHISAVLLHVEKTNESAMRLYERSGYSIFRDDGHRYLLKKDIPTVI